MTEKEQFNELCSYVKNKVLRYDDTKKIPKYLIMRLRGMHSGQFIANKKAEVKAKYEYSTILLTFKYILPTILNYINTNREKINDEQHLINLIMSFVEKDINTVVEKLENRKRTKEKLENIDDSHLVSERSNYIKKTDDSRFREDLK